MTSPRDDDGWEEAIRWLTRGDRSEQELRRRLGERGVAAAEIEATLQRLKHAGYVDDARVAANAAARAARRGHGSQRVHFELSTRGIELEHIEGALAESYVDEPDLARRVVRQRYRSWPENDRDRRRVAAFLARRGFPPAVIEALLGA